MRVDVIIFLTVHLLGTLMWGHYDISSIGVSHIIFVPMCCFFGFYKFLQISELKCTSLDNKTLVNSPMEVIMKSEEGVFEMSTNFSTPEELSKSSWET